MLHRSFTFAVLASLSTACAAAPASRVEPATPTACPPAPSGGPANAASPLPSGAAASATAAALTAPAANVPSTKTASTNAGPANAPAPLPPAFESALDDAQRALAAGDGAAADARLTAADAAAGDDPHMRYLVARARATRFALAGDFERAAAVLVAVIPSLARHPELPDEFWAHNSMMMVREAQGDPAAALAENDQATLAAARGSWDPQNREALAFQKDRWHRAYLTRMLAESRTGSVREALVQYARAALDDYRTRGFPDSVAVLEAYFGALDGKRDDALAAAGRVDPAKDDDVEDLYLVVVGLEAGGDRAAAEAVKRAMRRTSRPSMARAIMLRWLDRDAQGAGFTPWHAARR